MAVRVFDSKLLSSITDVDKKVIKAIYTHRCMTEDLLYRYFYKKNQIPREFAGKRIRWMFQKGILQSIDYGTDFPALFLTTFGIELYRYLYDLPLEVMDPDTGAMKNALRTSYDLKMKPNNLKHQMSLSEFHLQFDERAADRFAYTYEDEKFIRMSAAIRPDGLIQMNNVDLFLEMDMATESYDILMSKWAHYREFLKSKEYRYKEKKTVMLFILNNVKFSEPRRSMVLSTIQLNLLDALDSYFEVYVDSPEHLMDIVFSRLTPTGLGFMKNMDELANMILNHHQFIFSSSSFMNEIEPYTDYWAYIRKLDEQKHILIQDGRPQEFLFDSYCDRPLSVMKQIINHNKTAVSMIRKLGRKIPYLVMVKDEKEFYKELSTVQFVDISDVYFTTEDRLTNTSFPEAIFQYDNQGNLFHFTDFAMQTRVFERSVKPITASKNIMKL